MLEFLIDNIFAMFGGRVFQQTVGISISYAGYKLCSSFRRLVPLISSNSSYYHWVDVTAGGHFVPEDIIPPVAIKCMNLRRSVRILARMSPIIKRSEQDGTMDTVLKHMTSPPSTQLFLTLSWRTDKGGFIEKNGQRRYKYLVLGRKILFCKKKQNTLILPNSARIFDWQHICYVWWTCFSTDSRHTYGYKLCSSSRRLVPLFVWGSLHTGASQEKRKESSRYPLISRSAI